MRPLSRTARWISSRVSSLYASVEAFLAVGLGAAVLTAGLFALLARGVLGGVTMAADEAVVMWFLGLPHPVFDALAFLGAALGSSVALWIVLGVGTVGLWRTRHHHSTAVLWAALLGGYGLNRALKALFDRPRPVLHVGDLNLLWATFSFPTSPSFPSATPSPPSPGSCGPPPAPSASSSSAPSGAACGATSKRRTSTWA